MSRRTRTTALALTGAVALASAAYGLGSQRGDGSADAARGPGAAFRTHAWPGIGRLADRLGVSSDKLRAALANIRDERPTPDEHLADLATALGVSTDRLTTALEKLRGEHRDGFRGPGPCDGDRGDIAADLAKELGLSESKVQAALDEQRTKMEADREAARHEFAAALAQRLDLSVAKVEDVLDSLPHHWGPGPPRP